MTAAIITAVFACFQVMPAKAPGEKKRVKALGRSAGGTLTLIDTRLAGVALAQRDIIFFALFKADLKAP